MTAFNINKNVNESYSITIPGFTETILNFARFIDTLVITVASPHQIISSNISISSSCSVTFATPTLTPTGPILYNDTTRNLIATVTAMSYVLKVVTLTANNVFAVGDTITVAGIDTGFSASNIDGIWVCETGTNATTIVFTVTDQPVGTTPQTITVGTVSQAADCYILDPTTFITSSTSYPVGNYTVYKGEWSNSYPYKVWIPFVVGLAKNLVIRQAILTVVGAVDGNTDGGSLSIKIGCEKSGNAIAPINYNELNMRPMTAGFTSVAISDISTWSAGTTYTYNVTTAVQEILNHPDWVSGNTLAILCLDYGSEYNTFVDIAAFENSVYDILTFLGACDTLTLEILDEYTLGDSDSTAPILTIM